MLFAGVAFLAATIQTFAQKVLPEITITAPNYKYLDAVSPEEAAPPVNMVEQYAATYDIKGAEFYEDEYDNYVVSFFIPEGKILAAYNKEGKLLRTAEKFKNVAVPMEILQEVTKKFPKWSVSKDVYRVNYYDEKGHATQKLYKLLLQDGNKKMRIKVNDKGEIL